MVFAAVLMNPARGHAQQEGTYEAADDFASVCPASYAGYTKGNNVINNVGTAEFTYNPPQTVKTRYAPDHVDFSPSSIEVKRLWDGSKWGAEGPYEAYCVRSSVPNLHFIAPKYNGFKGSVWLIERATKFSECDDPRSETVEQCGDPGATAPLDNGSVSGGDQVIFYDFPNTNGGNYVLACYLTDWYNNGIYDETTLDYCALELK